MHGQKNIKKKSSKRVSRKIGLPQTPIILRENVNNKAC
jgi:hypothetical protein